PLRGSVLARPPLGRAGAQTTGSCCGCPSEDTLAALPLEMCGRGIAVTSEDRVSAWSLLRACLGARGDADLLHGARTIVAQD
ncbi:MAG TPA: hypothetical protein VF856_05115, partial [Gemmatimonadaceae bacterium]